MINKMVSVVITTYKRPTTLERAIESVLNQTYDNIEIIVVDDNNENSEDRIITENLMGKYSENRKIKYIKHKKNLNGAAARNTGIKYSKGDYVTFLDDDDELFKEKIRIEIEKIENMSAEYGAVYSGYEVWRNNRVIKKEKGEMNGDLREKLLNMEWGFGSGSNPLFKKKVVQEINGFDVTFKRCQDWEFMMRVFKKYKICNVEKILLRIYSDSRINVPNTDLYVLINNKYLNKFKDYIETLNLENKNLIYKNHFLIIAKCFIQQKEYKKFFEFYRKASSLSKITLSDISKIILTLVLSFSSKLSNLYDILLNYKIKRYNYKLGVDKMNFMEAD